MWCVRRTISIKQQVQLSNIQLVSERIDPHIKCICVAILHYSREKKRETNVMKIVLMLQICVSLQQPAVKRRNLWVMLALKLTPTSTNSSSPLG